MTEIPPLTTTLGRTVQSEHFFRGHASLRELMGVQDYWSMMSLALDGPILDDHQCRVADAIAASLLVPDPRLWFFKVGRLVSSYGNALAGIAAGQAITSGAKIGAAECEPVAQFQIDVSERIGDDYDDPTAVAEVVAQLLEEGAFLHGFGVPGRPQDERSVALEAWYEEHGRTESRPWTLYRHLKRAVYDAKGLRPNIGGTYSPMWREMGFDATQTMYMCNACMLINAFGNAYDGEVQKLATYRKLPDAALEYTGHSSRTSPRAAASSND